MIFDRVAQVRSCYFRSDAATPLDILQWLCILLWINNNWCFHTTCGTHVTWALVTLSTSGPTTPSCSLFLSYTSPLTISKVRHTLISRCLPFPLHGESNLNCLTKICDTADDSLLSFSSVILHTLFQSPAPWNHSLSWLSHLFSNSGIESRAKRTKLNSQGHLIPS